MEPTDSLMGEPSEGLKELAPPPSANPSWLGRVARTPFGKIGIACTVIIIAIMVKHYREVGTVYVREKIEQRKNAKTNGEGLGQPGIRTVGTNEWFELTCFDPSKRIDFNILTLGVWWEVMLDRDPGRILTLHPALDGKTNHLEITTRYNSMAVRVKPGQAITSAVFVGSIKPK